MKHKILAHDADFSPIAEGIWQITGSLDYPLKRNMTVVRLTDNSLLLYSVIALQADTLAKLDGLGKVTAIVVPSKNHTMDLAFYRARYPAAKVYANAVTKPTHGPAADVDASQALKTGRVIAKLVPGFKIDELYLEINIQGKTTLCVCDALAGANSYKSGLMAAIAKKLMGVSGGVFGVARIVKIAYIKKGPVFKDWLTELSRRPEIQRILVAHGDPLMNNIAAHLSQTAAAC